MAPTHWQRARQLTQIASVILFFMLAFLTYRGFESIIPLDLYFRVNPLVMLSALIAMRAFVAAMAFAIIALALGFVIGRAWCGWLCPLGAILDWITPKTRRVSETLRVSRGVKYVLLSAIFFSALMGNLTFLIFDPITILNRTFSSAGLPTLNALILGAEKFLIALPPFEWIEQNWRGTILPAQQTVYDLGIFIAIFFGAIIALNWIVPRFWCRYLCALGAVYALQAKISWLRPRAVSDCAHCAACMKVCPMNAITVTKKGFTVDPAECVVCFDCVPACPTSTIAITFGGSRATQVASFDLSRRHFIAGAAASVASVALFQSAPSAKRDDAFRVRPPGARENNFLEKCIRCAECVKVCPTGGLQPSLLQAGLEGFWTPILVSRLGYCDFSCNACGQICPTGAIPPLALEAKRHNVIGIAYIDESRCLPWASYTRCVVCEEMCPVPEKAIRLDDVDVIAPDGTRAHLQRPRVIHDLCIGCGICEYQCPLAGPAAIRVYAPTKLPPRL
ncbi:MAG: 4Fe-4S binding protein [Chloroflexi bacterium]|nr:4Fe-4S binding protein [Chloroflexota bacterium]